MVVEGAVGIGEGPGSRAPDVGQLDARWLGEERERRHRRQAGVPAGGLELS